MLCDGRLFMDHEKAYEYLKKIHDKKSVTLAASSLFVSQPSLSQYVIRLENELGAKILIREANPIKFTEFGEFLLNRLQNINLIHKSIIKGAEEINNLDRGKVVVGALNFHSIMLLSKIIPMFSKKYPNIEINIVEGTLLELEDLAGLGNTDFSILMLPLKSKDLTYDFLMEEKVLIAASDKSDLALRYKGSKKPCEKFIKIDINELQNEKFIILTPEKRLRTAFEETARILNKTPQVLTETNDITNAVILAASGLGITFCPSLFSIESAQNFPLTFFSPIQKLSIRPIVAAYNKAYPLSKSARCFLDMIKDFCQQITND